MSSVTVVIPWYGERELWEALVQRAKESVERQTVRAELIVSEGFNLHEARNTAKIETEFVIFLDADDELHSTYVERMLTYAFIEKAGDVFVPSVIRHHAEIVRTDQSPYQPRDLMTGNYIVIGAMIRAELFKKIGGWPDYPIYEDWAGYLRMEEEGAVFVQAPFAEYHVHVRPNSRNQQGDQEFKQRWATKIQSDAKTRRLAADIH